MEYITQGRFKTRQLYRQTPIVVETTRVDPRAYEILYQVNFRHDGTMHIASTNENFALEVDAHYGEPIHCPYFDGTIFPTELMTNSGKIYFRFRSYLHRPARRPTEPPRFLQ